MYCILKKCTILGKDEPSSSVPLDLVNSMNFILTVFRTNLWLLNFTCKSHKQCWRDLTAKTDKRVWDNLEVTVIVSIWSKLTFITCGTPYCCWNNFYTTYYTREEYLNSKFRNRKVRKSSLKKSQNSNFSAFSKMKSTLLPPL